jgi:hypothetical protein
MVSVLRSAWVAALLIITVLQVDRSVAQYSGTRSPVRRGAVGYQRYSRRHISSTPCINGISNDDDSFSDLETKIRETEFVFTGKVTAEIPSMENRDALKRTEGKLYQMKCEYIVS